MSLANSFGYRYRSNRVKFKQKQHERKHQHQLIWSFCHLVYIMKLWYWRYVLLASSYFLYIIILIMCLFVLDTFNNCNWISPLQFGMTLKCFRIYFIYIYIYIYIYIFEQKELFTRIFIFWSYILIKLIDKCMVLMMYWTNFS